MDVVGARRVYVKADGATDHERNRFGFSLADGLGRLMTALAAVQEFMRGFVNEDGEFLA